MSIAGTLQDSVNIRYVFTISGTPTTVNGADDNSKTLAYTAGQADVYLNGVKQVVGTDVTATSGSSVVFGSALAAGDVVEVVAFDTFQAAAINADNITSGTVADARLGAGAILQVVSTTKTDTFTTTTTNSFVDITGLSVSITPRSTSSKILIIADTQMSGNELFFIQLVRDSTAIKVGDSDSANRVECTLGGVFQASNNDKVAPMVTNFLDSPSTTSAVTYKLQGRIYGSSKTLAVNRTFNDTDVNYTGRGASTITAMEVQG